MPPAATLRTWARQTLRRFRKRAEVTIRVVGEPEGTELNERWRRKNGPTNVLSFPAGAMDTAPHLLGDIVICAPVVQREAAAQRKTAAAHWAHMVVHGILHLLGYDHHKRRDSATMEALEIRILRELGYPNPYH
jgi:probable rRNA maturation factor